MSKLVPIDRNLNGQNSNFVLIFRFNDFFDSFFYFLNCVSTGRTANDVVFLSIFLRLINYDKPLFNCRQLLKELDIMSDGSTKLESKIS